MTLSTELLTLLLLYMFLPIKATHPIALKCTDESADDCWNQKETINPCEIIKLTEFLM